MHHTINWRQTLNDFVWLQIRGSRNAEATQRRVRAALDDHGAPRPEALRTDMRLLATVDLRAAVSGLGQPSLLIAGQNDRVVPPEMAPPGLPIREIELPPSD